MRPEKDIFSAPSVNSLTGIISLVKTGQEYLLTLGIDDITGIIDKVSRSWSDRNNTLQQRFGSSGLNYLLYWFRKKHLSQIIHNSLRTNRKVLDSFCETTGIPYKLKANPRGIISHWLAGNVPMLGMLSLVQGLLTKNANILKVPRQNGEVIPLLLNSFNGVVYENEAGVQIHGSELIKSVAAIYFERDDMEAQKTLSLHSNVRVAWGGMDAVELVMNLPRRYGCEDVIFGPRTSFIVIGKEFLESYEQAKTCASRSSIDASIFEQQGCNSPHTVFVEKGGQVTPLEFAGLLGDAMAETLKRFPKGELSPGDTLKILNLRTQYDMMGEAFYPSDMAWTVLYGEDDTGLATPCFNRTLFVRPVDDVMEVVDYCNHLTQTAGIALSEKRRETFVSQVTARGIDRCPDLGAMSSYDTPWDGMFVVDRFVRWSKL
ncbi:acyl-CoA reductase [candidate division CSSED10-310 bacterium]|uniref:Acyl-CoA reductase n=1 Tax=candidate division CSSED10-310 bacterium TaxID=2855610 RepID=A0ABV6YVP1_UNCC1